ncbi:MAG: transposase [Sterolibacteriaceae bacterium]|nr:transposase [Sterolibacteriaceae bacterium]
MTLRYSRRSYRQVVWKSSSQVWAWLHEQAFRYFGGCCQYVVLDNLKEGVIRPDIYEPQLNRLYAAMLAHYAVVADPAAFVIRTERGPWKTRSSTPRPRLWRGGAESIEAQNAFLMHWEENWAAKRIHGRAKRQVEEMFQEERAHLKALPIEASATSRRARARCRTTPPLRLTAPGMPRARPRSAPRCWSASMSTRSRSATCTRWR